MAIKSVSIRIEEEMLNKIGYVADYEGRSVNSHVLVLIRENIKKFEELEKRNERKKNKKIPVITESVIAGIVSDWSKDFYHFRYRGHCEKRRWY